MSLILLQSAVPDGPAAFAEKRYRRKSQERVELGAAKAQTGNLAVGRRDDAKGLPGRLADLDPHLRGHIDAIVAIHAHPVGAALVDGIDMQIIVALLVDERPVGLNQVAVDLADAAVADAKKALIGSERHAGGPLQIGVDDTFCRLPRSMSQSLLLPLQRLVA